MTDSSDPRLHPDPNQHPGHEGKLRHPKHDPCCEPCVPPTACELQCLVRPEFHCGQELTEEDLNALVRWTDRRLARVRYRDGWGIVCGLDLCIDPRCPTRVIVDAGYAVGCCGDDLVLCDPDCVDLRDHCQNPCLPGLGGAEDAKKIEAQFAKEIAERLGIKHVPLRLRKCVGVDICLASDDRPVVSVPRPHCGCKGACHCNDPDPDDHCAVTRRRESARLVLRPACEAERPEKAFYEKWEMTRRVEEEIVHRLKGREDDPDALHEALAALEICALGTIDRIFEDLTADDLRPAWSHLRGTVDLKALLFWLIIDRRLTLRDRKCHACDPDDLVCLGRAWLFSGIDRRGQQTCFIGWLDTGDPVRRRLAPPALPARPGHVNLVEAALGQEPATAALALSGMGIDVQRVEQQKVPLDAAQTNAILDAEPFVSWNEPVVLIYAITGHGRRVIGWRFGAAKESPSVTIRPGRDIDVERVSGIGPARATDLREASINTVGDLSDADPERLLTIIQGWRGLSGNGLAEEFLKRILEETKRLAEGGA